MEAQNKKECFEIHLFSLMADFMIEQSFFKEEERKDLTLREIKTNMRYKKNFESFTFYEPYYFFTEATHKNFITFLEKKIKQEAPQHQQQRQKHAYYWNKNKEAVARLTAELNEIDSCAKPLNQTLNLITEDLESVETIVYKPKLLSDVANFQQNKPVQYKDRTLLIFKTLDSIKHTEYSNQDGKPRFKVTSLYKEKRQNLDDLQISTAKTKDEAQKIIVKTLIELANSHSVSLKHLSYIILKSIDRDGYSSIKDNTDNNGKKLSADFEKQMNEQGIYTGKTTDLGNADVGLRLKRLPKAIIEILNDNRDRFKTKDDKVKIPYHDINKKRDKFILDRLSR